MVGRSAPPKCTRCPIYIMICITRLRRAVARFLASFVKLAFSSVGDDRILRSLYHRRFGEPRMSLSFCTGIPSMCRGSGEVAICFTQLQSSSTEEPSRIAAAVFGASCVVARTHYCRVAQLFLGSSRLTEVRWLSNGAGGCRKTDPSRRRLLFRLAPT